MSERIDTNQVARSAAAERIEGDDNRYSCELEVPPRQGVREPSTAPGRHHDGQDRSPRPAHPSNQLIAQLNATWRVVDDPLQWKLQRKKGNPRSKNTGWASRSFCTTREALLRCVREYCGNVEPAALAKLIALPEHHAMQNLDVRKTSRAQVQEQPEAFASLASGGLKD